MNVLDKSNNNKKQQHTEDSKNNKIESKDGGKYV